MQRCLASLYYSVKAGDPELEQNRNEDGLTMASFNCKDLGMDGSFEVAGVTEQEIMRKFIAYAETELKMPVLSADVIYRVQKAIKK